MADYKFNGTDLTLEPTEGIWLPQDPLGIDGNGHAIYPATRQFEMRWGLISVADAKQIFNFFDSIGNTGTVVATLPQFKGSSYTFFAYSGCVLYEPEFGAYYAEHRTDLTLLISNIRV